MFCPVRNNRIEESQTKYPKLKHELCVHNAIG